MEKLISKITKPKLFKSYSFYELDGMFAVLPDDPLLHDNESGLTLTPLGSYIGLCFIDGPVRVAIVAFFNQTTHEYELIGESAYLFTVDELANLKVSLIKPNKKLVQHQVIQDIRRYYGSIVGVRATRLYRWCDNDRFEGLPDTIACYVLKKDKKAVEGILPVYNISYVGKGLWGGILALDSELLGLKKDDMVVLSTATQKDQTGKDLRLFIVEPEIECEKSSVLILPYEKKSDAKRKFYTLACPSCDYEKTFYLGRGANTEREFDLIVANLNEYGAEPMVQDGLVDAGTVKIDYTRELYACRYCGQIETKFKTRYLPEDADYTISISYFCSECGEMLTQVRSSDIKKLKCPNCDDVLAIKKTGSWDILPPEEGNYW